MTTIAFYFGACMLDGGGAAYFDESVHFGANAFPRHGDFFSGEREEDREREATNSGPNTQPSTTACRSDLPRLSPDPRSWAGNPPRWEGNSQAAPAGWYATTNGAGKRACCLSWDWLRCLQRVRLMIPDRLGMAGVFPEAFFGRLSFFNPSAPRL